MKPAIPTFAIIMTATALAAAADLTTAPTEETKSPPTEAAPEAASSTEGDGDGVQKAAADEQTAAPISETATQTETGTETEGATGSEAAKETEKAPASEPAKTTPAATDDGRSAEKPAEQDTKEKGGLSDADMAKANNPLADTIALNLHTYYVPESDMDLSFLRFAVPFFKGRLLMRATLPFQTMPGPNAGQRMSGLGDLNVFLAANVISKPTTTFGFGPMVNAPTSYGTAELRDNIGSKWQLGAAVVFFKVLSPVVQMGGLLTWQKSLGDEPDLKEQNLLIAQPFLMVQLGKGLYMRSAAMWSFDFEYENYTIPFGLGLGKIMKAGKVVFNGFLEPTFTLLSNNPDQALLQLFAGLNLQFITG